MAVCRPMPELAPVTTAILLLVDSLLGMQRANQSAAMRRENRTATLMHNPARSLARAVLDRFGRECDVYTAARSRDRGARCAPGLSVHRRPARRAAGAHRPKCAARRDDGDRRRPALGRRPAERA